MICTPFNMLTQRDIDVMQASELLTKVAELKNRRQTLEYNQLVTDPVWKTLFLDAPDQDETFRMVQFDVDKSRYSAAFMKEYNLRKAIKSGRYTVPADDATFYYRHFKALWNGIHHIYTKENAQVTRVRMSPSLSDSEQQMDTVVIDYTGLQLSIFVSSSPVDELPSVQLPGGKVIHLAGADESFFTFLNDDQRYDFRIVNPDFDRIEPIVKSGVEFVPGIVAGGVFSIVNPALGLSAGVILTTMALKIRLALNQNQADILRQYFKIDLRNFSGIKAGYLKSDRDRKDVAIVMTTDNGKTIRSLHILKRKKNEKPQLQEQQYWRHVEGDRYDRLGKECSNCGQNATVYTKTVPRQHFCGQECAMIWYK